MKKASVKDIFRTIWNEKKRFFSIMMITVLGVTMMTGIEAGCRDLKLSADKFYDSQDLFDISIMSTLGLTEDDVLEIQVMEGIEKAEGTFTEIVHTKNGEVNKTAEMKIYRENGLNIPYVLEGRLPLAAGEIAVNETYLKETGKSIGDHLVIEEIMDEEEADDEIDLDMDSDVELEEEETPNFSNTEFVIVGTVIDVMDINNAEGSAAFRATPNADYTFFVTPDAVDSDVYTAVYVTLEETEELLCYAEEYETKVAEVLSQIETRIMEQRELARYKEVTDKAYEKIAEKEEEMYDTFADIEQEFADAWEEIGDGWQELNDGKQELIEKEQEAKQEIADARKELEDAYEQLNDAWLQLNDAEKQLNIGAAELEEGKELLRQKEKEAHEQLDAAQEVLKSKIAQNDASLTMMNGQLEEMKAAFGGAWSEGSVWDVAWNDYVAVAKVISTRIIAAGMNTGTDVPQDVMLSYINAAIDADTEFGAKGKREALAALFPAGQQSEIVSLATGIAVSEATDGILAQAMAEFVTQKADALAQIEAGWAQLYQGELELEEGRKQISDGRAEVIEHYQEWKDGLEELNESEQEALIEIADAWEEIAEGEQELIDGEAELQEHEVEYQDKRVEAEDKIAEAKQEVADIDMTKW